MDSKKGAFPRPDNASKAFFASLIDGIKDVDVHPMFGNLAGFVNGNMCVGLFGHGIFVRLNEAERAELLQEPGASTFAPMKSRPMKEYVMLPDAWRTEPERARAWAEKSIAWASSLPAKKGSAHAVGRSDGKGVGTGKEAIWSGGSAKGGRRSGPPAGAGSTPRRRGPGGARSKGGS